MTLLLFGPLFVVLISWAEDKRYQAMLLTGEEYRGPARPYVMLVLALYAVAVVMLVAFQARWWTLARRASRAEQPGDRSRVFRRLATSLLVAFAWLYVIFIGFWIAGLFEDVDYELMNIAYSVVFRLFPLWAALTGLLAMTTVMAGIHLLATGGQRRSGRGECHGGPRSNGDRRGRVAKWAAWTILGCSSAASAVLLYNGDQMNIVWPVVLLSIAVAAAGVTIVIGHERWTDPETSSNP